MIKHIYILFILCVLTVANCYSQSSTSCGGGGGQGGGGGEGGGAGADTEGVGAADPNLILSPIGFDTARWVSVNDNMGFAIYFENDPEFATAPAHNVYIYYQFNTHQDATSFRLGSFGFNGMIFNVPPGKNYYQTRLDLRDSLGLYVDLTAGINVATNTAFWIFQSIDPLTNQAPLDPLTGFLPIKDTSAAATELGSAKGEGFVNFTVKPINTAQARDTIFAQAKIVFDVNDTIPTNTEFNTIDAYPPVSHINQATVSQDTIHLYWTGQDDNLGSGIKDYALYVSVNNEPFILYKDKITGVQETFIRVPGNTYCFFVRAKDNTGNEEALKTSCEVTILPDIIECNVTATAISTNASCGAANGSVNLTVTGGTPPYTYLWNNGAATEDINSLAAGIYNVTVTDAKGCTATTIATVNNIAGPAVAITNTTNVLCFGQSTGSINITVTGGTAPLSYMWSNGAVTEDINGLAAGTYNVTVTDANECTASVSVTITQPANPLLVTTVVINTTCGNASGSIDVTISGGTSPYTITWNNGAATEDLISLPAGNYTASITDANGCTATTNATVNNSSGPAVVITGTTNVLCFGQSTGSINITVTGGATPYTYLWSNGAITEDIISIAAGQYTVTVTDANKCTVSASVTITQPASALSASSNAPPITSAGGSTTVTVTATGGTAPYTGTGTFTRTAGTYTFTVTDANGCTATTTIILTEPVCSITLSSTIINVSCFGGNNGAIDLTVIDASGAVTYNWSNGATTQDLSGLTAGTYTVTVHDAQNCSATATITITQPASAVIATATAPAIPCGGTTTIVTVSATGGTAPYTGTGTFTRGPGTYAFTVTDAKECTASETIVIAAAGLVVNAGPDNNLCNGPVTLTANISGAVTSGPPQATPFNEVSGSTGNKRIFIGNIDYITIGNTFSQSEDRNNCNKISASSKTLTLPAGAVVKKAYLYWSGSGNEDNTVKLNGETITAGNIKTYSMPGGFRFFSARANVTNQVSGSGNYTVSNLNWNNGSPYCFANSAYGAWAMTIVYEMATLPAARIHINTEKFQYTYPAGNYSTTINNISLPAGCISNAKLTIVAFEGDNYIGEGLKIGGQNFGDNNFRSQSGPNLDILSWNIPLLITPGTSSLIYTINAYQSNSVFGQAVDGLFDYVKVLKYNICTPSCNAVSYLWSNGATTHSITVSQPGSYNVRVMDCSGCIARDTVNVSACPPVDPDKCYKLIARHSGKALTIEGSSTSNGGNAEQRSYNDDNNQKWKFEEVETGFYKVTNVNSGKVLDVNAGSTTNGTNIQQWTWVGGDDQRWGLERNTAGYYGVKAKHSGKYMSVENSSTANGANVEQRGNNANDYNRQWDIGEVGCPNTNLRTSEIIVTKDNKDKVSEPEAPELSLTVQPNPGTTFFNLTIKSSDNITPVNVRIFDANGKIVSVHQKITANSTLTIRAEKWAGGIYFLEATQGNQHKAIRLVKSD